MSYLSRSPSRGHVPRAHVCISSNIPCSRIPVLYETRHVLLIYSRTIATRSAMTIFRLAIDRQNRRSRKRTTVKETRRRGMNFWMSIVILLSLGAMVFSRRSSNARVPFRLAVHRADEANSAVGGGLCTGGPPLNSG